MKVTALVALSRLTIALVLGIAAAPVSASPRDEWLSVGKFDMTSGRAVVSDPCYEKPEKGSRFAGILAAKKGKWSAAIRISDEKEMGKRVAELLVLHESTKVETLSWSDPGFTIGVDSGTAGVFDDPHFRDDSVLPREKLSGPGPTQKSEAEAGAWYEYYVVGMKGNAQIVPFGVLSYSGFGDGGYRCLVSRGANGKIDGIRIIFIEEGKEGDKMRALMREVLARPSPLVP